MILLAIGAAAAVPRFGPSAGVETNTNDPFLYRRGPRIGFNVAPVPWADVGLAAAWYPVLGDGTVDDPDLTPLSKQLLGRWSVKTDLSKVRAQAQLTFRVHALRVELGRDWRAGFGFLAGVGLFDTLDMVIRLQVTDPEVPPQLHVGPVAGMFWQVGTDAVSVRLRYESDGYVETVDDTTLLVKDNAFLGLEVLWWL